MVPRGSGDHSNVRMGFRNRAIVGALLYCGLRRSEVLALITLVRLFERVRRLAGLHPLSSAVREGVVSVAV